MALDRTQKPNPELPADVMEALHSGQTILAIKRLRAATGMGLKEAKDAVDAYANSHPNLAPPKPTGSGLSVIIALAALALGAYLWFR